MLRRRVASGVLLLALVLVGACAADPRALDSGELHDLIQRGLEQADQDNALHFDEDEADCVADRVVADISDERLEDLGVDEGFGLSTLDFTPEEQDVVFAALHSCLDLVAQVAATIGDDAGLTSDQARCVAEGYVADGAFREAIFSQGFDAELNDRVDAALGRAVASCGLPSQPAVPA